MGLLLLAAAAALLLLGGLWLVAGVTAPEGRLRLTGALLGGVLLAILVLPMGGAGVFLLIRSGQEVKDAQEREQMRKILDMVKSRGQLPISDLVVELGSSRQEVQDQIYELVGMGVFSGFINWEEGILYSEDAAELRELDRCKNCGGELKLVGKGVITCPYCGTEYFLS